MSIEIPSHAPVPELHHVYSNIALTQNIWVTVVDESNVRFCKFNLTQATADEDVEVEITDDAGVHALYWTATAATPYSIVKNHASVANLYVQTVSVDDRLSFIVESRKFKLRVRKTTAAGANATNYDLTYGLW